MVLSSVVAAPAGAQRSGQVRRTVLVAAALVLLTVGVLVGSTGNAAAVIPGRTVLTFNMFGYNGGGGPSNAYSPSAIFASVQNRSPLPTIVTLTEVCNKQLSSTAGNYLWANMASIGYTLAAVEMPVNPGGDCGPFGVVSFVLGSKTGDFLKDYPGQNGFLGCGGFMTGFGPLFGCSVHLSSTQSEAATQWSSALTDMISIRPFGHVIWAGDLNMDAVARSCNNGVSLYNSTINGLFYPAGFTETDADAPPLSTRKTWKFDDSSRSCHLDYIGYDRDIWAANLSLTRATAPSSTAVSDHFIYEGTPGNR